MRAGGWCRTQGLTWVALLAAAPAPSARAAAPALLAESPRPAPSGGSSTLTGPCVVSTRLVPTCGVLWGWCETHADRDLGLVTLRAVWYPATGPPAEGEVALADRHRPGQS